MSTSVVTPRAETRSRTERPKTYRVLLLNDDYTPRHFVVSVLRAVFRMTTSEAEGVMLTAHQRGRLPGAQRALIRRSLCQASGSVVNSSG